LVDESALSNVSQAMPSRPRSIFQLQNACTSIPASGSLDQHRAAQAAPDADRRDPAFALRSLEHVEHVQNDSCAGCAYRMPQRDRAAIHVELRGIELAERAVKAQLAAAIRFGRPCAQARDHLRGESLVDLPRIEIVEAESKSLQDRR